MKKAMKRTLFWIAVLAALVTLAGCGGAKVDRVDDGKKATTDKSAPSGAADSRQIIWGE